MQTPQSTFDTTKELRVAIYTRVAPNCKASYDQQLDNLLNEIADHPNWKHIGTYTDYTYSTKSVKERPEFRRMIQACVDGKIDLILIENVSRLSRKLEDVIHTTLLFNFSSLNARIFFRAENIFI